MKLSDYYETPELEERQPIWTPKKTSETKPAAAPEPLPIGSCEFVGARIYDGSLGRKCSFGSVCFSFGTPALFEKCPARIKKLKERRAEKILEQT